MSNPTYDVKVVKDNVDKIFGLINELEKKAVVIGYPEGSSRKEGEIDNATLAYIMENGSPARNIPARPFLEPGVRRAEADIGKLLERGAAEVVSGSKTVVNDTLNRAGILGVGAVQQYMTTGHFAPLSAQTIRRKKSSKPLIDTGQLRQAVTYVIRDKP